MENKSDENTPVLARRTVVGMIGAALCAVARPFSNGSKLLGCTVPADDDERRVGAPPQLRFQIVADRRRHETEMKLAEQQRPKKKIGDGKKVLAEFVPYGHWEPTTRPPEKEKGTKFDWSKSPKNFAVDDSLRFIPVAAIEGYNADAESRYLIRTHEGKKYVLAYYDFDGMHFGPTDNLVKIDPDTGLHYVLVYNDKWNVVGDDLQTADKELENFRLNVCFTFNAAGAAKFAGLTGEYSPDRDEKKYLLGVAFNGRLRSAAILISKISGGAGQISGFKPEEVDALLRVLGKFRKEPPRVKARRPLTSL